MKQWNLKQDDEAAKFVIESLKTHVGFSGQVSADCLSALHKGPADSVLKSEDEIVWLMTLLPQFSQIAPSGDSVNFPCLLDPGQARRSNRLADQQSVTLERLLKVGWDEEIVFPTHLYDSGAIAAIIVDPKKLGMLFRLHVERKSDGPK